MTNPVRILHYGMSPSVGGIESFIMNIYRKIDKSKIQFDFISFCPKIAFANEIEELGGNIYRLSSRKESFISHHLELKEFFEKHKEFVYIHFHLINGSYIKPLKIASEYSGSNIIVHSHSAWSGNNIRVNSFHKYYRSQIPKYSDLLVACSDTAGEYLFEENYTLLKNGIDIELYNYNPHLRNEIRDNLGIQGKFVIGHVGRLSYPKNHDFILETFSEVYKLNKNSVLLLVGKGELEVQIERKINELGLTKAVIMLGLRKDIYNILQAMDIFLFPSHFEGLPITLIEAQAAGLPCIVSDVITRQVKVTDLVEFYPLSRNANFWAEKIMEYHSGYPRTNTMASILKSGYEINSTIKKLEDIYLNPVNK